MDIFYRYFLVKLKTIIFYLFIWVFSINISVSSAQSQSGALVVAAIGDSITAGLMRDSSNVITCPHVNLSCNGNGVMNVGGFSPFLATQLTNQGYVTNVFNWGYSGAISRQLVDRISSVISISSPTHITIMAGANDATQNISDNTLKFNIEVMAQNAISKNVIPVLSTVTPDPRNISYQAEINKYNVGIREIAQRLGLSLADQFTKMNENFSLYNSGDLKHFNNLGNLKMAEEWVDAFISGMPPPPPPPEKKVNINPVFNLLL